ncbi:MAG: MBOAT family protein [Oscillospiraceae bacterium]|nr:MBOAT family protein [Oscillospiraceae bacterium]
MVFSSAIFLFAFLPAVFILSRLCRDLRAQNALLAAASIVFYAFGQLRYVPLFLLSVCINYLAGRLLLSVRRRKAVLALAVVLDLGILAVFKYTDFVLENLGLLLHTSIPLPGILLPIGISFFTFQGMSYVIDTYRDPANGTRDFLKLLLYISFFPQLIAGPIVKYHDVADQIDGRRCTLEETAQGVRRFIRGLAKKILVADTVGYLADLVFGDCLHGVYGAPDTRVLWLGVVCYTLQIYYDFSGYSDMAIGLGHMFGFRFRENFLFPYGAASIRDFWRRWHVSLSSWFKEYLYIPLGGNRRGKARTALHKLLVFLCTGIWHGANWTFVLWGLGHGLLASLEDWGVIPAEKLRKSGAGRLVCRLYTLLAVALLFAVFRADSLRDAAALFSALFSPRVTTAGSLLLARFCTPAFLLVFVLAVLLAGDLVPRLRARLWPAGFEAARPAWQVCASLGSLLLLILSVLCLAKGGFHPFIYFQF